jgi:predicted GTPase
MVSPGRHHLLLSNAFHWLQSVRRLPVSCRPLSRSWLSAHTGYNLPALVELIVHALPVQASSTVYCQLKPEHQTPDTDAAVRQQFGEAAGKAFDTVINPDHLPSVWTALLRVSDKS